MSCLRVMGGVPLEGEIKIQGSKNAVLPMMAAALLIPGKTRFENCPDIADVRAMTALLEKLGAAVTRAGSVLEIDASAICPVFLTARDMADTRGCILLLGALAARFGEAEVSHPGGCVIGKRPVDLHLFALAALGARLSGEEVIRCQKSCLSGAEIVFPIPSVGATQNALLAAVLADGQTWIHNAAREPEVVHLCNFLNAAGAKITGAGTPHLKICGVKRLFPVQYAVPPDRIVAGTYMAAVLSAGGRVLLKGADAEELSAVIRPLRAAGGRIKVLAEGILAEKKQPLGAFDYVKTEPYPGFPTDMQSQFLVLASLAEGVSVVEETIFEARFAVVPELRKMGARIYVEENKAVVEGGGQLLGNELCGRDLRGTAALVIAALSAEGESIVRGMEYLERGYENFVQGLRGLGAKVEEERG